MPKKISALLAALLLVSRILPVVSAAAPVAYMPGVTEEMTRAAYWTAGLDGTDKIQADADEIAAVNAASLAAEGTNMHDLRNLSETVDAKALAQRLKADAEASAEYYLGWTYSSDGQEADQSFYDAMIANTVDPEAREDQPVRFAVAVVRTQLLTFPSDELILDDPKDPDFDYQNLSTIRVNEPVVLRARSADGNYYAAVTSSASGWVRAADVAVCADKDEWLSAWDFPADRAVVIYGDRVWTSASNFQPETAKRMLTMGTVLELADWPDPENLVANRASYYNYVVYLPVRTEDGSYEKRTVLLPAVKDVSLGYLPLTYENISKVAMNALGDVYGWGGMLESNDCSGFLRDVYHCFGLDLPRNTTWQTAMPAAKADLTGLCSEEKCRILDALPLGSTLYFKGHTMLYLGQQDKDYYVLSSVSKIMNAAGDKTQRIRGMIINTLDVKRASGNTWLQDLNTALVPYQTDFAFPAPLWYHDGVAWCLENKLIDPEAGGYFLPDEPASRAVIAEALWRESGKPEPGENVESFPDVEDGAAYEKASRWAREQGVIEGVDGTFLAGGVLTREQLVTMLYRFLNGEQEAGKADLSGFADAGEVSDWAAGAMSWAVERQIIRGKSDTELKPRDAVTRAELAVILERVKEM